MASTLTEPRRAPAAIRLLTREMRAAYLAIAALVVGLGFSTFVLTEHTERWWAWTIKVPMTAALLGAGYWAGLALLLIAVREREWARHGSSSRWPSRSTARCCSRCSCTGSTSTTTAWWAESGR